jgi:hypothetical protein
MTRYEEPKSLTSLAFISKTFFFIADNGVTVFFRLSFAINYFYQERPEGAMLRLYPVSSDFAGPFWRVAKRKLDH